MCKVPDGKFCTSGNMCSNDLVLPLCPQYVDTYFVFIIIFFFKQKTAYEMLRSLVGSEMCIRDRSWTGWVAATSSRGITLPDDTRGCRGPRAPLTMVCLLYTSDAADDLLCVDLGGRRIIKQTKQTLPGPPQADASVARRTQAVQAHTREQDEDRYE